jgi:hypothetical protein
MSLMIQHGHGKSDKIDHALQEPIASGVIFAARNEKPVKLQQSIDQFRDIENDSELLIDPQFHISTMVPPNDRFLSEYGYYSPGKTLSDFTPRRNRKYVREVLGKQLEFEVDGLLSPTVIFNSFTDRWYQTAINLADESIAHYETLETPPPLYLSFILSEQALASEEGVDLFLDTITQEDWSMNGFYLTIAREERSYRQAFDNERLARWLYLVYVLSELNGLRVICGYSDFVGLALRAVGADSFSTGWSHSLRQFHKKSYIKQKSGGQQPKTRYSSGPLYNSILFSELLEINEIGRIEEVLSDVQLDELISDSLPDLSDDDWNKKTSEIHHWQVLSNLDDQFSGDVESDVINLIDDLTQSRELYRSLVLDGVSFETSSNGEHLTQWIKALRVFQKQAGFETS